MKTNKTVWQDMLDGWFHSVHSAQEGNWPFNPEELRTVEYLARLGAWYHKHQHVLDHMIQNTLSVMEMEVGGNPHFYKAIEDCKLMQQEKPQEF